MNKKTNLIWIDLEMTGLVPEKDIIIEIATVVTDADLNVLAEGPSLAIHQDNKHLDSMDEWNTRQHTKSGLVQRVKESEISLNEAEKQTLDFLMKYVDQGLRRCAVIQSAKTEDFFTTTCPGLRSFSITVI